MTTIVAEIGALQSKLQRRLHCLRCNFDNLPSGESSLVFSVPSHSVELADELSSFDCERKKKEKLKNEKTNKNIDGSSMKGCNRLQVRAVR